MKTPVTLDVNGVSRSVAAAPDEPLALVLRNELGLTGAKVGCALEQCGACAVLVDGVSTLACVQPAADFEGRRIETVEALGTPEEPGPVQQALLDARAAQCGYCTPGLVVAITALLRRNPCPDDGAIRAALEPHLCRCGAHPRVLRAVRSLAPRSPRWWSTGWCARTRRTGRCISGSSSKTGPSRFRSTRGHRCERKSREHQELGASSRLACARS